MKQLQASVNRLAEILGMPGILGLALIVFSSGFYFSTYSPEQLRLEELRLDLTRRDGKNPRTLEEDPGYSREALGAFYGFFPPSNHIADQMRKVYGAAGRQGLRLERGEYRAVKDSVGKLVRYQATLPLKGTYPQVRKFVASVLVEVPNLSLESIQFERQRVGDPTVEAKVKLVLYLGQRS